MAIGTLYVVATPIGNLEDISLRALRILKEVDLIACEDTRHTRKLLEHFEIKTPRVSYHEHNECQRAAQLLESLRSGSRIALVSDAGTPLISDPGYDLIVACRQAGIPVFAIPGPSAVTAALSGSGLPSDNFYFAGFLPARRSARRRRLETLADIEATLIFYEAPHRVVGMLEDLLETLGPRRGVLARELTKIHEEWLDGSLPEILERLRQRKEILGEITVLVERGERRDTRDSVPESIGEHLDEEMSRTGADRSAALKSVARQRGLSRKEAYKTLVEEKRQHDS